MTIDSSNIKKLRKDLGLSQTELGVKLGVSMRTIQNWEGGKRNIPEIAVNALKNLNINNNTSDYNIKELDNNKTHKIKEFRQSRNITQDQMVELTGIKKRSYVAYENNQSDIPLSKLQKIATALKVSIPELIGERLNNIYEGINNESSIDTNTKKLERNQIIEFRKMLITYEKQLLEDEVIKNWLLIKLLKRENEVHLEYANKKNN